MWPAPHQCADPSVARVSVSSSLDYRTRIVILHVVLSETYKVAYINTSHGSRHDSLTCGGLCLNLLPVSILVLLAQVAVCTECTRL